MTRDQLITLARLAAASHGLPPEVLCGQVERESQWNPWAIRFEPKFESHYVEPLVGPEGLSQTEALARSISWGLCQVLGEVARELGFQGKYLSELSDPVVGLEYGCRKLAKCLRNTNGDMARALEEFNGGGNKNYASEVLALAPPYRLSPIVTEHA